jgi:hypothetical protein
VAGNCRWKKPQGPATSFVVACALAPVAGALGYKLPAQRPLLQALGFFRQPLSHRHSFGATWPVLSSRKDGGLRTREEASIQLRMWLLGLVFG